MFVSTAVPTTYWFGHIVYLRTRADKLPGFITELTIRPGGVLYWVSWGSGESSAHYEFELTNEFVPDYSE